MEVKKNKISIIGGGAAALAFASFIDENQYEVSIYERNKSLGQKFLVAGKGGFNLTHSERIEIFTEKYSPNNFLSNAINSFTNLDFRSWLDTIGIPTYIGSSKRIYPVKGIKPIEVLNAVKAVLHKKGISINYGYKWIGWKNDSKTLIFENGKEVEGDIFVFSTGGGSWKVTGSDGTWLNEFNKRGVETVPFAPANCAYKIAWPKSFIEENAGQPLKNIAIKCMHTSAVGEVVITEYGIEGNAIYRLTDTVHKAINSNGKATIQIDLKPSLSMNEVKRRLLNGGKITSTLAQIIKLEKVKIRLIKSILTKEEFLDLDKLASSIKSLKLVIIDEEELDKAISTTGGISINAVEDTFQLKKMKDTFCIGEMLDWNAPTGGYLLQACFSMGYYLAQHLNSEETA